MRTSVIVLSAILWLGASCAGLWRLFQYESKPGAAAMKTIAWPESSGIRRSAALPTLVLFVHPQCPCSRATIGELDQLMAECRDRLSVRVYVYRPKEFASGWEWTDIARRSASIPGVQVVTDVDGGEARKFGALTSGQVFLFDPSGRELFQGGITAGRGHAGDNAGRSAIVSILTKASSRDAVRTSPIQTPVYGCSLVSSVSGADRRSAAGK